jgi:hypothetical protein
MPTIQNRRATKSQWALLNPVLAAGEIGYELGTNKLKVGNGLSPWNLLKYFVDETVASLRSESLLGPHPELFPLSVKLANALTEPINVGVLGGSQFEGVGGANFTSRFPRKLQDTLNSLYAPLVNNGEVFSPPKRSSGVPVSANDWVATGSPVNQARGPRGTSMQMGTGITITGKIVGTSFKLFMWRLGSTDVFTVSVDGGAAETVTLTGGARQRVYEKVGLSTGIHDVVISWVSGTPVFCGSENPSSVGVRVWDLSVSGASAEIRNTGGGWGVNATDWSEWIGVAYTPDLFIIGLLFNDAGSRTSTQYKTDMQGCIDKIRSKSSTVPILLCPGWGPEGTYAGWVEAKDNYLGVLKELADLNAGVVFHNLAELVPEHEAADFPIYNGSPHMNDRGQTLHARLTADALVLR